VRASLSTPRGSAPYKLLLIEDNEDDLLALHHTLKSFALPTVIEVAGDGEKAIEMIDARQAPELLPDLVLVDLKLPKIDGVQVLRHIRSMPIYECVPVVMFTSSSEKPDVQKCYKMGGNSYVQKKIDFDEFQEDLRLLLQYWLQVNIVP
jgi:two-component system, response regulator